MTKLLTAYSSYVENGSYITTATLIGTDIAFIQQLIAQMRNQTLSEPAYATIQFHHSLPEEIRLKAEKALDRKIKLDDDAYLVVTDTEGANIYASNERGFVYGASNLMRTATAGFVKHGYLYNNPLCSVRGVKLYLPPPEGMEYFKSFVDLMCRFHFNTIVLEVGGAMEYKRHPEINEGWVRYCEEMMEYSGKTIEIQEKTFSWYKNSIHVENGGGRYLSQEQVSELVVHCKERKLEVIPEIPCLSHCDYLLINHPEISERKEDPYPDTYCPSDERSYDLLFDVLDEVLEVFAPERVHIGHDEWYSVGLCDTCKGKPAAQIFADDIKRIHAYLKQRGAETMMWGEKLINASTKSGKPCGGSERPMTNHYTGVYMGETIPATHEAIDLIPEDIQIMHWYWSIDETFEDAYLSRGMNMVYGNFFGSEFVDWRTHLAKGPQGAIISNWSVMSQHHLQRNGILFSLAYSAYMFWHDNYDDSLYEQVARIAFDELYQEHYERSIAAAQHNAKSTTYVEILHTTNYREEYVRFYDGVLLDNEAYRIGDHVLDYGDGTEYRSPIIYGLNISNEDVSWERECKTDGPGVSSRYTTDPLLMEVAFSTRPERLNGKTYYQYLIINPFPNKRVVAVRTELKETANYEILVEKVEIV